MPYHSQNIEVVPGYATADTPWGAAELQELLTSNKGRALRRFNPETCSNIWGLPKASTQPDQYLLRRTPLAGRRDVPDRELLYPYATQIERLRDCGTRQGLSCIVAPLALYLATAEEDIWAYSVVKYIDDGKTLEETAGAREKTVTIRMLGAALTDYLQPGAAAYLQDISALHQYSTGGTLYDYDPGMLVHGNDWRGAQTELQDLEKWYPAFIEGA